MLKTLQRFMPVISILLLITLLVTLFLYPNSSSAFSIVILTISIGAAIFFTIHRNWEILRQAQEPEKSNGAARKQLSATPSSTCSGSH